MTSTKNMAVTPSFEKLEPSSNYIDWKYAMEIHLINRDLMYYVDGTKTDENKSRRALAAIVSGVEIRELKTEKEVWERLRSINESEGFSTVAAIIEQLVSIRYADCLNMDVT
ncbi:hypothetical protein JTB14_013017 [Gonioctena quinquepunctata]|nr:hypothetical protein JTB14_013017 [Gonioctena quinquepunctata]